MHYNKPAAIQQPSILKWLRHRLKLLENTKIATPGQQFDKISTKNFSELFNPSNSTADELLWADILELEKLNVVKIHRKRKSLDPYAPAWQATSIAFQPAAEMVVRLWLDCPIISPLQQQWKQALDQASSDISKKVTDVNLLHQNPFPLIKKSAREILERILLIPETVAIKPMTAYQLSATLFWGNSKLLKDKEDWLQRLFDLPPSQILPRPLLFDISFPRSKTKGMLLIENKDSYIAAADGCWPVTNDLILIYMQGNQATAGNLRNSNRTRFHLHSPNPVSRATLEEFESYWYQEIEYPHWLIYAITDMDWSGIAMFSRLKSLFPELEPWQPGYNAMLSETQKGNYHRADASGKTGQEPITTSGSTWLDKHVLPVLKKDQFVDQEAIQFDLS